MRVDHSTLIVALLAGVAFAQHSTVDKLSQAPEQKVPQEQVSLAALTAEAEACLLNGSYERAEVVLKRIISLSPSKTDPAAVAAAVALASVYIETLQFGRTRQHRKYLEVLASETALNLEAELAVDLLITVGAQSAALEDFKVAQEWLSRALERLTSEQISSDAKARAIYTMGLIAQRTGDFSSAERYLRESLALSSHVRSRSASLVSLAALFARTGRGEHGAMLLQEGVQLFQAEYGTRHPVIGLTYLNYALALEQGNKRGEAKRWRKLAKQFPPSPSQNALVDIGELRGRR
jgi:tetratricopeptide (TPR) repeat protein